MNPFWRLALAHVLLSAHDIVVERAEHERALGRVQASAESYLEASHIVEEARQEAETALQYDDSLKEAHLLLDPLELGVHHRQVLPGVVEVLEALLLDGQGGPERAGQGTVRVRGLRPGAERRDGPLELPALDPRLGARDLLPGREQPHEEPQELVQLPRAEALEDVAPGLQLGQAQDLPALGHQVPVAGLGVAAEALEGRLHPVVVVLRFHRYEGPGAYTIASVSRPKDGEPQVELYVKAK